MEAADRHGKAALQELAGEIHGVRELVGLDADQADQALAAAALDLGHQPFREHARIGLVDRPDDDVDVGAEHLTCLTVLAEPMEGGQGVRWNVRAKPGDRIAVIIVMSRLDQK